MRSSRRRGDFGRGEESRSVQIAAGVENGANQIFGDRSEFFDGGRGGERGFAQFDRLAVRGKVLATIGAVFQMPFQNFPLRGGEMVFQIVEQELQNLAARHFGGWERLIHDAATPKCLSRSSRNAWRARCNRVLTLARLKSSNSAVSSVERSSMSRRIRIVRYWSGN